MTAEHTSSLWAVPIDLPGRYFEGCLLVTATDAASAAEAAVPKVDLLREYSGGKIDLSVGTPETVADYERRLWPA